MAPRRAAVTATVLLALLLALTGPAQAARPSYVAMGDSYSSGTGTGTYLDDGTLCQRSVHAYPSLVASARGYKLDFQACLGATIPHVIRRQLPALTRSTAYVTVSVGGNDAGFAGVLLTCAQPRWAADCHGAVDATRTYVIGRLPDALGRLYTAIRTRAPSARVVVVGYPRIFNGTDCNAGTWFSTSEMRRLNATADLLNRRMSSVASAAGFAFADPTSRFLGHAVCDRRAWVNGLSGVITESYHPTVAGHRRGYLPKVGRLLAQA
jgi:lysophospholipase L1-like esterase